MQPESSAAAPKLAVSVIVPTYNRREWLPDAIESVLKQTVAVHEVIVVDDGSTDGTMALQADYPLVTWLRQSQQGPSAARNTGAAQAGGNWLAFLDSDDRWLPEKLARQIQFLRAHPRYEIVYTNEIWIRNGQRVNPRRKHGKFGGWIYVHCLPLCIISPSSVLLSRKLWEETGGFDPALPAAEDYDLWLRIAARHPIGYLDEMLIIKQGGHPDQLSRQWGLDRYRVIALDRMLQDEHLREPWRRATLEELVRRCRILEAGCRKHDRTKEAEHYRQRGLAYQQALAAAAGPPRLS